MFQKFNFDTEWAVKLISRLTDDDDVPIVGHSIMKQVWSSAAMFIIIGIDMHMYSFDISNPSILSFSFQICKLVLKSTSSVLGRTSLSLIKF